MSRVYNFLSTTVRPSVTQIKQRAQPRRRPFTRFISTRSPPTDIDCILCLNNSRRFRARVRLALGGVVLFVRTSLEKSGLWYPLLNLLTSSVGVTAARLTDGVAVLTACLLILEAGLTILGTHGEPRRPFGGESGSGNGSVVSDLSVKIMEGFLTTRRPHYDAHAPPISLAYLRSPFMPFGMPFLKFSSAHRDAVARALDASRSPAGSELGDGFSSFGNGNTHSIGSELSGGDNGAAIVRTVLTASLA